MNYSSYTNIVQYVYLVLVMNLLLPSTFSEYIYSDFKFFLNV